MRTLAYIYVLCVFAYLPYAILTEQDNVQVTVQEPKPIWCCDNCGVDKKKFF